MNLDDSLAVLASVANDRSQHTNTSRKSGQKQGVSDRNSKTSTKDAQGSSKSAAVEQQYVMEGSQLDPALPVDPYITGRQTMVEQLDARFQSLCSRILPFGNVGELELQVLALTSAAYVHDDGEDTNMWLKKSRLSREFGLRWFLRLKNSHSEPHRALHTLSKIALLCSYLDEFWPKNIDNDDNDNFKSGTSSSQAGQHRTAAEVIGSGRISKKDGVELAIWFQDAVCRPGDGDIVSKRESADLFESFARNGGIPDAARCRISRLIRRTAVFSSENNPARKGDRRQAEFETRKVSGVSPDKETSRSASKTSSKKNQFELHASMLRSWNRLFLFGSPPEVHNDRASRLRLEYRHLPDSRWFKRRGGVLREYLGLRRFMEPDGGKSWLPNGEIRDGIERRCRSNCKRELESLRHGEMPGLDDLLTNAGGAVKSLQDQPRYLDGGSGLAGQVVVTPLVTRGRRDRLSAKHQTNTTDGIDLAPSVSHCTIGPGSRTLRQILRVKCVYFVLRGRGEIFRGGLVEEIQSEDYVEVMPHIMHYFSNRSSTQNLALLVISKGEPTSTRVIVE